MPDKSEIFEELERRVGEAHVYLRIDQAREELTQLESRAARRLICASPVC